MMSLTESNSMLPLIALLALLVVSCGLVFFVVLKRAQNIDRQVLQETKQMQRLLQGQLVVMGQRVLALEQSLRDASLASNSSSERHDPAQENTPMPDVVKVSATAFDFNKATSQPTYARDDSELPEEDLTALAQQLLEAGESPVYVAERCNLSQSEMDLLQAMCKPAAP